jgi:hypothetical protein
MTRNSKDTERTTTKPAWLVVVVYEDPAARERAVAFCDQVVGRMWAELELEVGWWSFDMLREVECASEAAEKAAGADVIIFSAAQEGEFPLSVKAWMQAWLSQRGDREGKLVGLLEPGAPAGRREGPRHLLLRNAAHHCAMDYLTEVPQDISLTIPESFDSYAKRARQITSLLDDILHRQPPPPTPLP